MDIKEKQTRYSLLVIILILFSIVTISFYNIFIKGDYEVVKLVECDPEIDACFVADCDGSDPDCDSTTYKKITVSSNHAGSDFDSLTCLENSAYCKIVTCQISALEAGEKCFQIE